MEKLIAILKWGGAMFILTIIHFHIRSNDGLKQSVVADQYLEIRKYDTGPDTTHVDPIAYDMKWQHLVHNSPSAKWPVRAPYPLAGALLPFNRIVAFYGNFFSAGMGILGQLPEEALITKLKDEATAWAKADTSTRTIPAIHYIAVTAQSSPGKDHKYRLRMPASEIEKAIRLAGKMNGLVFLDVQVGHSTLQEELPLLMKYLAEPNVHLGIDPEYSMKDGQVPCSVIGRYDADDVNYASGLLKGIVTRFNLPPKILVVHRFTKGMLTNSRKIRTMPEVQIVINMDGFGWPSLKMDSYNAWVAGEPVQFTGFKIFYKQDLINKRGNQLMTPEDVLKLYPSPVYIQYQ